MKEMLSSKNGEEKDVREALTDPTVTVCKGRQLCPAPRNVQADEWQQRLLHFHQFSWVDELGKKIIGSDQLQVQMLVFHCVSQ